MCLECFSSLVPARLTGARLQNLNAFEIGLGSQPGKLVVPADLFKGRSDPAANKISNVPTDLSGRNVSRQAGGRGRPRLETKQNQMGNVPGSNTFQAPVR